MDDSTPSGTIAKRAEAEFTDAKKLLKRKPWLFGVLVVAGATITIFWLYDHFWGIPALKLQVAEQRAEIESKKADIILLNTQLAPFKTFALEKYGGDVAQALVRLSEDVRKFDEALKISDRKIRSLSLSITFEFSARWKDGELPDPSKWLMLGGSQCATGSFIVDGKKLDVTEFHHMEGIQFALLPDGRTRLTYRTSAIAGSQIFGVLPESISSISELGFVTTGVDKNALEDGTIDNLNLKAEFFVNGKKALVGETRLNGTLTVDEKHDFIGPAKPLALTQVP